MTIVNVNGDMTKSYNHMMLSYDKEEPFNAKEKPMRLLDEKD